MSNLESMSASVLARRTTLADCLRIPLPAQGEVSLTVSQSRRLVCSLLAHTPQFTAKSLQRQSKKANKDEAAEKNKLKQVGRGGIRYRMVIMGEGG
jgi:hypothetical protein